MLKKFFHLVFRKVINLSVFFFRGKFKSVCLYTCFLNVYPSPNFLTFIYYLSIYYIIKCGLHYLAMFKLFQRIIFARVATPRVLWGVANLASNSHLSNHCSFRDMTFFMIFSKNLDFEKFQKVEDFNPVVGYCEGSLWGCESCLWLWLLQSL